MTLERLPESLRFIHKRPQDSDELHLKRILRTVEQMYFDIVQRLNTEIEITEEIIDGTDPLDHGVLEATSLLDDDHTIYLLADGTRALGGAWSMGNYALTNVNIDSGNIKSDTVVATEWDAAYTHSTDNSQAHSDYLLNNANDSTNGTLSVAQLIDNGLTVNLGVYTDGSKQLTSTPPTSGILGYWGRAGTVLSPATAGDDITTTGLGTFGYVNITDEANGYQIDGTTVLTVKATNNLMVGPGAGSSLVVTDAVGNVLIGPGSGNTLTDEDGYLIIDNQTRGPGIFQTLTQALVYGIMAPLPSDQSFTINADDITFGVGTVSGDTVITFNDFANAGFLTWKGALGYFLFSNDVLIDVAENIYFRDVAISINSADDGHLDLTADISIDFNTPLLDLGSAAINTTGNVITGNLTIGVGAVGVDYTLTFDGENDDCVITYDEDNNILNFGDTNLTTTGGVSAGASDFGDGGTTNYMDVSATGDAVFVGSAGLPFADVSVYNNSTADTVATATWAQMTRFDTDGENNNCTPDHTNDHITITKAGRYMVNVSASFSGDPNITWYGGVWKNNGATQLQNMQIHRKLGAGGDVGCVSMGGIGDFAVNDTVEIWIRQDSGANKDIVVVDCCLAVSQLGGT